MYEASTFTAFATEWLARLAVVPEFHFATLYKCAKAVKARILLAINEYRNTPMQCINELDSDALHRGITLYSEPSLERPLP